MSIVEATAPRKTGFRFERWAPLILLGGAFLIYVVIALATDQAQYLSIDNLITILVL